MESHGYCAGRFEAVRDAFKENFTTNDELGASACVVHDGQVVVDLWGGSSAPSGEPWQEDTIVNVYSTTKTMAAVCMLMLADRGLIDFDAPVARYWPEFAQNGKADVLVRHVMSHSAGLSGFFTTMPSISRPFTNFFQSFCGSKFATDTILNCNSPVLPAYPCQRAGSPISEVHWCWSRVAPARVSLQALNLEQFL